MLRCACGYGTFAVFDATLRTIRTDPGVVEVDSVRTNHLKDFAVYRCVACGALGDKAFFVKPDEKE